METIIVNGQEYVLVEGAVIFDGKVYVPQEDQPVPEEPTVEIDYNNAGVK